MVQMHFPRLLKVICAFMLVCFIGGGSYCVAATSDPVKNLTETAANSALSFKYGYEAVKGNIRMTGEGNVCIQGCAYMLEVDGISFYCDGETRWTVDGNAKEVVIESVGGLAEDIYSNPVLLVVRADDMFVRDFESTAVFNGESLRQVTLRPRLGTALLSVSLYFKGLLLRGAAASAEDGTDTVIYVRDLKEDTKKPLASFRFDDKGLDASWVITDLR